ncbi:hypothetical protein OESDEN_03998, partial [Oesophagostomum dentatum]
TTANRFKTKIGIRGTIISQKRTRSDALQGKSEGPAKKQLLISDWFSGTRRRTGSSASDLQIL